MNIKNILIFLCAFLGAIQCNQSFSRTISPLPQSLANITLVRGQNNTAYYYYITGASSSSLWGTGVYTDDSSVAAAAVHAGLLAVGQTGVIKVTVKPGQSSYQGSSSNGVNSANYGSWSGSYTVSADDGGDNPVLPDTWNLSSFRDVPGGVYQFTVTGVSDSGSLWGSNAYSDDSSLAKAAVHAGVLSPGQTGTVRVVIVPAQTRFTSSVYNGITSSSYGQWAGAFAVSNVAGNVALIPYPGSISLPLADPGSLTAYRGKNGGGFYFQVVGSSSGSIWGSQIYTDDSSLAKAAVHAGVLSVNQSAKLKATISAGLSSYSGSTANGVTSSSYGSWSGSYSVSSADANNGLIPDISSSLSATGGVGRSFSYQITATDSPTEFNATGLPEGLSVSSGGLISGTPKIKGLFQIDLSATNAVGTGTAQLQLSIDTDGSTTGTTTTTSVSDCIFNWAEAAYPNLFSPANKTDYEAFGYTYRYYSATNSYIATHTNGRVYVVIPGFLGSGIVDVGDITYFKGLAGC